ARAGASAAAIANTVPNIAVRMAIAGIYPSHRASIAHNSQAFCQARDGAIYAWPRVRRKPAFRAFGAGPHGDLALSALQRIGALRREVVHD
ncbi:MAG: hypothetical protein Q8K85_09110, partial [Hyphomicrobium sp.]|nr:hypothetical protein [Hyphomicrobium sp.]